MNREIKFQYIWGKDHSIAKAIYTIEDIEKGCAKPPRSRDGSRMKDWDLIARRQYTGLKDKNGVEIYEGDVVESDYYEPDFIEIAVIGYDEFEMRFFFKDKSGDLSGEQDAFVYGSLKVIGNIHENPELLEK